ncbi:PhzF family phenazine biosynthesis protein [Altericroceibacterium endophyticum]|uniref:PhzF family phenazine biosynthesis isomerase n=1 Tax=Altericroceibacterium endophyticum TaxID=1808508 RepID=A0A6I4T4B4_9SPHN|nr:PhzF family phenazine biosynthesis protein [Altericroceibacterium endophyticum]MXO65706.1 PhzF family phenazine biosynthesis isomerase [Altericroceibacterium endophyticum]
MTGALPYWHVDAFSARPFGGNQAAVMPLPQWLPDAVLQAIGEENNFAETAFLVAQDGGPADYELRWFTPECEIRLCGHATLASGHVLLSQEPERDHVTFATRQAGILEVRRMAEGGYALALPVIETQPHVWAEAVEGLGSEPEEVLRNKDGYTIFRYASETIIRRLTPDFDRLARLGDDQFICTAPGDGTDVVSRVFVPGAGLPEDSVTGSAHAALTPYWATRLGRDHFTAHQASRRGGDLSCRLDGDRAWLGGPCTTVVDGQFYLPE